MSTGSVVAPHDEMRARDVNKVTRGEQAPRPAHELGSISQAPPPPPNLPIKVEEMRTAPAESRFPTTNQTRHCYTRYIEYHRCRQKKGDEAVDCEMFAKYYRALCPTDWAGMGTTMAVILGCFKSWSGTVAMDYACV